MRHFVIGGILLTLAGCGFKDEVAKLTKESENWRQLAEGYKTQLADAQTNFKEQSEKWQEQSKNLSAAMVDASTKLDPLAIKTIYQDNRELTKIVEELRAKVASAVPQGGTLMLADAQLRFDVSGYKGRSVIRAYLDDDQDPFLDTDLSATEPVLPLPYNLASGFFDEIFKDFRSKIPGGFPFAGFNDQMKDQLAAKQAEPSFAARRAEIDARYKNAVTASFSDYSETREL